MLRRVSCLSVPARRSRAFSALSAASGGSVGPARRFRKILVANRGEIAARVIRSAQKLHIETVAVFSDADERSQHVQLATEAFRLGPAPASESYLNYKKILEICALTGAEAVHPGYGFLSENAEFARACADAGIEFIGPPVPAIEAMGSKSASKDIMIAAGVPVTPGYHGDDQTVETLQSEARKIGYPVLIKAVLGGGGKGMRIVDNDKDFVEALEACQREGKASFGDARVLIEKYLRRPRHVELQVFGDKYGNVIHLMERDCSVQRRHQKVLEEAPAPHMTPELREKMGSAAVAAAKAVGYVGAGTVEFLLDEDDSFYFMEMNTRLQVEHPVTEMITRQDLVELQLQVAAGEPLPIRQEDVKIHGHAIEARIYAENPYNNFLPGSGTLRHIKLPQLSDSVRVDTGVVQDDEVSIFYDPMIAKLIVHGPDRDSALDSLIRALHDYQIVGLATNNEFVARTAAHPEFRRGGVDTSFLNKFGDELLTPLGPFPMPVRALAAASVLALEQRRITSSPLLEVLPSSLANFRSLGSTDRVLTLKHDSLETVARVSPVSSDKFEIYLSESGDENEASESFVATGGVLDNGDFEFRIGGRKFKGTAVVHGHSLHVFCDDGTQRYKYVFEVPPPAVGGSGDGGQGSLNKKITTPMPGKIIKVLVKPGDEVKADQPLLIMEAMKMEHVMRAAADGTVGEVWCAEGDFVGDGHVLIELA